MYKLYTEIARARTCRRCITYVCKHAHPSFRLAAQKRVSDGTNDDYEIIYIIVFVSCLVSTVFAFRFIAPSSPLLDGHMTTTNTGRVGRRHQPN